LLLTCVTHPLELDKAAHVLDQVHQPIFARARTMPMVRTSLPPMPFS
jgi:hypothetical protein